jgi:SAM-dependent methyltransferase
VVAVSYARELSDELDGLDPSPEMVAEARQRHPDICLEVGDLRRLMRPVAAAGWGAVLGWYSLIHLAASELPGAVAALARPLAPGGLLVLGLHAGAARIRHSLRPPISSGREFPARRGRCLRRGIENSCLRSLRETTFARKQPASKPVKGTGAEPA